MQIKADKDLSPVEFEILNKARDIAAHMFDYLAQRAPTFLNAQIRKHGPLSQVILATFFSEIACRISANCVYEAKRQLDRCEDGEHSLRSLLNDLTVACELRLGLKTPTDINKTMITYDLSGLVNSPIKSREVLGE